MRNAQDPDGSPGSAAPSCSSRSAHSSRGSSENAASSIPACRSPSRAKRAGTVAIVKSCGLDVVDLVPADRGGDGPLLDAADRVGAGDRVVASVLVVVDEYLVDLPILAPPRRGRVARGPALDLAGERQRRPADIAEPPARLDPDVDVHPRAARRLRPTRPPRARRAPRARRRPPGGRGQGRIRASGRDRSATRRAARHRPGASSTGETQPSPSAPPRSRSPARSRTARRRGDLSGKSTRTVSIHGGAPVRDPLLVHLLAVDAAWESDAACTAARAARARSRRRRSCSTGRGRAWSRPAPRSTRGPGWRAGRSGRRPRSSTAGVPFAVATVMST